jgi:hypothetical protein
VRDGAGCPRDSWLASDDRDSVAGLPSARAGSNHRRSRCSPALNRSPLISSKAQTWREIPTRSREQRYRVLQTGAVICPISNIWPISIGERPWRIETAPRHRFSPGPDFAPQLQSFKQNRWPNSIHNPGAPQRGVHAVSAVQAVLSSPQFTARDRDEGLLPQPLTGTEPQSKSLVTGPSH